jgi:hypothetical protein
MILCSSSDLGKNSLLTYIYGGKKGYREMLWLEYEMSLTDSYIGGWYAS